MRASIDESKEGQKNIIVHSDKLKYQFKHIYSTTIVSKQQHDNNNTQQHINNN